MATGNVMVINEDHKRYGLPLNDAATYLYRTGTNCPDIIYGSAVIGDLFEITGTTENKNINKQLLMN